MAESTINNYHEIPVFAITGQKKDRDVTPGLPFLSEAMGSTWT
jgi:hypothetical protein